MKSFDDLYNKALDGFAHRALPDEFANAAALEEFDPHHLDCLLHPDRHPPVLRLADCDCSEQDKQACQLNCFFHAITRDEHGNAVISEKNCVGCGDCIEHCKARALADRKDIFPAFELLYKSDAPVYAMIAPAFLSQFSADVTPGMLRSAFKALGFAGMIEVALFADMLTLKEALEFDRHIHDDHDFLLTSCCCPIWIAMIRKVYTTLVPHIPPSVSPMVACGRSIKLLYPDAKTMFIGPCVAKKAEAREPDVADAVDLVLNFQEMRDIFAVTGIDPAAQPEDLRDHSSTAGRIYARTGGVSRAVQSTVDRLVPHRQIPLRAEQANGAVECKALLKRIVAGDISANFLEGMGCIGGCVGGPKVLIPREEGAAHVDSYGAQAAYETPVDNPYVMELLHRLGFENIESLLQDNRIFTRNFLPQQSKAE